MKKFILVFTVVCFSGALCAQSASDYRADAERGDKIAQYNLGYCYDNGYGVTKDLYEAFKWYKKSAEQGNAQAQFNLGVCYYNGDGVTKDLYEAVKWYKKSAEQGFAQAQCSLGVCYNDGNGVTEDKNTALYWYEKASKNKEDLSSLQISSLSFLIKKLQEEGYSSSKAKIDRPTSSSPSSSTAPQTSSPATVTSSATSFQRYILPSESELQSLHRDLQNRSSYSHGDCISQDRYNSNRGYSFKSVPVTPPMEFFSLYKIFNGEEVCDFSICNGNGGYSFVTTLDGWNSGKSGIWYDCSTGEIVSVNDAKTGKRIERNSIDKSILNTYKFETIFYTDGDKYSGETKNGKRDGYGIYYFNDGRFWFGQWKDGQREGYGALFDRNKFVISTGKWVGDTKVF
ncbi:MAG: hypothetical protein LBN95_03965 [Prevotellaceae bacterium]|jgi:hypothetical protein|nr:hypothetical protein [Prevotellaceae bacterium]